MAVFAYLAGLFTILAALLDWDWYFRDSRAAFFVRLFGRGGARIFYGLLGVAIVILGYSLTHQAV